MSFHTFAVGLHAVLDMWFGVPNTCLRPIRNLQGEPGKEPCVVYRKVFGNPEAGVNMHVTITCLKYQPKMAREVRISVKPI